VKTGSFAGTGNSQPQQSYLLTILQRQQQAGAKNSGFFVFLKVKEVGKMQKEVIVTSVARGI